MKDIIIIGNGPAGISASIYVKRSGLEPLVISKHGSSLLKASEIENYYGFKQVLTGKEIYENGIEQAKNLGIEMIEEEVMSIMYTDHFIVETNKNSYEALSVIIATGLNKLTPRINGLKDFEGKGVSYCAICDGFFFRKKVVAVLGSSDYALHEASELEHIASKVYILTNGEEPTFENSNFEVIKDKISSLSGNEILENINFENGTSLECRGLFVALKNASGVDFARKIGAEVENNFLKVNNSFETNIPLLYGIGDVIGGLLQVSKAVSDGAKAGMDASRKVKELKKLSK